MMIMMIYSFLLGKCKHIHMSNFSFLHICLMSIMLIMDGFSFEKRQRNVGEHFDCVNTPENLNVSYGKLVPFS